MTYPMKRQRRHTIPARRPMHRHPARLASVCIGTQVTRATNSPPPSALTDASPWWQQAGGTCLPEHQSCCAVCRRMCRLHHGIGDEGRTFTHRRRLSLACRPQLRSDQSQCGNRRQRNREHDLDQARHHGCSATGPVSWTPSRKRLRPYARALSAAIRIQRRQAIATRCRRCDTRSDLETPKTANDLSRRWCERNGGERAGYAYRRESGLYPQGRQRVGAFAHHGPAARPVRGASSARLARRQTPARRVDATYRHPRAAPDRFAARINQRGDQRTAAGIDLVAPPAMRRTTARRGPQSPQATRTTTSVSMSVKPDRQRRFCRDQPSGFICVP